MYLVNIRLISRVPTFYPCWYSRKHGLFLGWMSLPAASLKEMWYPSREVLKLVLSRQQSVNSSSPESQIQFQRTSSCMRLAWTGFPFSWPGLCITMILSLISLSFHPFPLLSLYLLLCFLLCKTGLCRAVLPAVVPCRYLFCFPSVRVEWAVWLCFPRPCWFFGIVLADLPAFTPGHQEISADSHNPSWPPCLVPGTQGWGFYPGRAGRGAPLPAQGCLERSKDLAMAWYLWIYFKKCSAGSASYSCG